MKTATKNKRGTISKSKGIVAKPIISKKGISGVIKKSAANVAKAAIIPAITNEAGYNKIMAEIEQLVEMGGGTIKNKDLTLYSNLAKAAQVYEQRVYTIAPPGTLEGLLEWKMYELKLKQKELAKKLHVSDTKLSLVMSGKQKPDTSFLKSIHKELGIDGNILLSVV